jgi:hypothetical protein
VLIGLLLCLSASAIQAQPSAPRSDGRPLIDVLRELQRAGLRIIFSSRIVTPEMRVFADPRARDLRRRLDEVLAPHALLAVPGPAETIVIIRGEGDRAAPPVRSDAGVVPTGEDASVTEESGNPVG